MTSGPDPHVDFSLDEQCIERSDTEGASTASSAEDGEETAYALEEPLGASSSDQPGEPTDIEGVTPLSMSIRKEEEK